MASSGYRNDSGIVKRMSPNKQIPGDRVIRYFAAKLCRSFGSPIKSWVMISTRLMVLLLLFAGAVPARSTCELGKVEPREPLSERALERRNSAFRVLCERSAGKLIDAEDTAYAGRLSNPTNAKVPNFDSMLAEDIFREAKTGSAILAVIVEDDGRVSWVSVIDSTGSKEIDLKLGQLYMATKFAKPARLDGERVRVFFTTPIKFRADGS